MDEQLTVGDLLEILRDLPIETKVILIVFSADYPVAGPATCCGHPDEGSIIIEGVSHDDLEPSNTDQFSDEDDELEDGGL